MSNPSFPIHEEQPNRQSSGEILDSLNDVTNGMEPLELIETAYQRLELKEKELKLKIQEKESSDNNELHEIRKTHLQRLFYLTCAWSVIIVYILISQGLERLLWFSATPSHHTDIGPFKLDTSIIITFITSTTATIIGLYTIGAYWLFKKK